jgi:glycosyltransferase involved in cell wall biosynthesis
MEVWVVANFPPPVHGVSEFNRVLCQRFETEGIPYRKYPIGSRGLLADVGRATATKAARDLGVIVKVAGDALLVPASSRDARVVYFTASQTGAVIARDRALAAVCHRLGVPLVAHIHGCAWIDTWRKGGLRARAMIETLRACTRVICLGPSYAADLEQVTGVRTVGINNGVVDLSVRAASPHGADRLELLFLSNLMREKGLWVAARAAERIYAGGRSVRLRCAGAWKVAEDERSFRRDFAASLGTGIIELVGFANADAKRALLASSHVFLLPTVYEFEGQPLALLEAMAAGLVPITTRTASIADLMQFPGGELMARAEHRDADTAAASIQKIWSEPAVFARLAASCRAHYEQALTEARCSREVIGVLQAATRGHVR